jgi:PAS domain S-box-containing protein
MAKKPTYKELEQRIKALEKEAVERGQVEQALRKTDGDIYSLLNDLRDGFFITDSKGTITFVNKALGEMGGYENPEEMIGTHFLEYLPSEVREEIIEKFNRAIEDKDYSELLEFPAIKKDGSIALFQLKHCPVVEDNRIIGAMGIIRDITERRRTEDARRESEERVRALMNATTESALLLDSRGTLLDLNKIAARRFGGKMEQLMGLCIYDLMPAPVAQLRKARIDKVFRSGAPIRFEDEREGDIYDNNVYPVFDGEGKVTSVAVFGRQITEQKRAEEALLESEERYRSLFEDNHSVMLLIDPENADIVDANPAACSFYGFGKEDLTSKKITDINMLPEEELLEKMKGLRSQPRKHFFFPHRLANGEIRKVASHTGPITLNGKQLFYSMIYDVTEQVQAQNALQESEARLRTAIESLPFDFFVLDMNGRCVMQNSVCEEHWGDAIGKRIEEVGVDEETLALWKSINQRAFAGEVVEGEVIFKPGGKEGFYHNIVTPIYDGNQIQGILGVNIDITERMKVEKALRESEEKVRALLNAATESAFLVDNKGTILAVNKTAAQRFGRTVEEITGMCAYDLMPPHVAKLREAKGSEVIRSGVPIRFEDEREGEIYDTHLYPVFDAEGNSTAVAIFSRQISVQKRAEEAQLESEKRYRLLVETMNDGMVVQDEKDLMTYANDRFCEMLGYPREDIIGRPVAEFVDKASESIFEKQIAMRRKGKKSVYELRWYNKDGGQIPTISSGAPIFDAEGVYEGSFAVVTDITDLKSAEQALKQREAELEIKTSNLEEANTALKVLLKRRDEDKSEIEEKVLLNTRELVAPYLDKLKRSGLDERQKAFADILESNLNDIISPFARTLAAKYLSLTPTEIQVASLVRQGRNSKEIAGTLNLSTRTICFHRENIRKKIGINNKKANLRTQLQSLQ